MKKKIFTVLTLILVVTVVLVISYKAMIRGSAVGEKEVVASSIQSPPNGLSELTLDLKNLDCTSCEYWIRKALEKLDGLEKAEVSYFKKMAVVYYDPSRVQPAEMVAAVEKTGYSAMLRAKKQ